MEKYYWLILGTILGLSIAVYFFVSREERREETIEVTRKVFSTKQLDNTMKLVVDRIKLKITTVERELTEEEKNEIIKQCCKENFNI